MVLMNKTPTLWSLVGIYFNQDWPEDYGSEEASIDAFLDDAPDDSSALLNELEWVLEHFTTETDMAEYLPSAVRPWRLPRVADPHRRPRSSRHDLSLRTSYGQSLRLLCCVWGHR
jgi:hypothetical protein